MIDFELLPHTADIKIRAYGATMQELYRHALVGMFQSIKPNCSACRHERGRIVCDSLPCIRQVRIDSYDKETLLVDFLSDALYLSDVHNEAYFDASFTQLTDQALQAELRGVPIDGFEVVEIKAVTYHDLIVTQVDGIWQADVVFDI